MKIGQRMIRLDDGMRGTVEMVTMPGSNEQDKRVVYHDRGEKRVAAKAERWVDAEPPPVPLRAEEKLLIALWADKALRAYEKNEPFKSWDPPKLGEEPYDTNLVLAVLSYLTTREALAITNQ